MTTNLWIEQFWYDYKLKWNPEEYGGEYSLNRGLVSLCNNASGFENFMFNELNMIEVSLIFK